MRAAQPQHHLMAATGQYCCVQAAAGAAQQLLALLLQGLGCLVVLHWLPEEHGAAAHHCTPGQLLLLHGILRHLLLL
jgi:hypothetical protein